ncbi:MAG: hypothetical protein NTW29_06215 [Bacteroidetes bacterium]|nr:hypothetical protein [Bacteroidota bacterium]
MKDRLLVLFILITGMTLHLNAQNNLGIGTATPAASAKLDVSSSTQGILIPRMTTAARNAIVSPAKGLMVYDSTLKTFYYHDGTAWGAVGGGSGASLQLFVSKNATQTTQLGSSAVFVPDSVSFQTVNTGTLMGGNTWNIPANSFAFKVGPTGAGLYLIDVRISSSNIHAIPMLDFGGVYAGTSVYGLGVNYSASGINPIMPSAAIPYSKRGLLQTVMYLNAGDSFKVRAQSSSQVVGADLTGDAGCRLTVVKLN